MEGRRHEEDNVSCYKMAGTANWKRGYGEGFKKKKTPFDELFAMQLVVAEYHVTYETLRGRICGDCETHEAYAGD